MTIPTPFNERRDIHSWGRTTRSPQRIAQPAFRDELRPLLEDTLTSSRLAIGLRRSYGDSCLNSAGALVDMSRLDRFLSLDVENGVLRAEAGVSLSDILRLAVLKGWFLPTTPGTRFVTLGGAIANDVHGKNHHRAGSFGRHVRAIGLLRSDLGRLTVTPESDPRLFNSTIGGLGLTGVIEWAELRLSKIGGSYLDVEIIPYDDLDAFWALAEESADRFEHTVAWIDSTARGPRLGRGIFSRANWIGDGAYDTHDDESWKRVPIEAPEFVLNRWTVGAFNELYYRVNLAARGASPRHYTKFFYPLDAVKDWNKLYGRRGLMQYQCVVPRETQREAILALLDVVTRSGRASFLAVLKTFGDLVSPGLLSFPRPGATLALDFPFRGNETLATMAQLDSILMAAGGALYPAKDGRISRELFQRSFPRWEQIAKDPAINSDFWRRVAE